MKIRPWLFPSAGTFTSDTNPVAHEKIPGVVVKPVMFDDEIRISATFP
jgi:hypothetical protein